MKRAIVTGGAGFIGSHMVDLLLSKNFKVIVVDDLSGGHTKKIKQHFKNKNFSLKKKNILTIKPDDKIFNKVDYVFHFAGIGDIVPSIEKPTTYMQVNVQGTVNILEASRFHNVKKLVYAASASCYGLTKKLTNGINITNETDSAKELNNDKKKTNLTSFFLFFSRCKFIFFKIFVADILFSIPVFTIF